MNTPPFPVAAGLAAVAFALLATPVAAQSNFSPCGTSYVMESGDTLSSIAQACGIPLDDLLAANAIDDPRNVGIGAVLTLPGDGSREPAPPEPMPDGERIEVQPLAGAPGVPVTVRGFGLTPGSSVEIGVGPPESEFEVLFEAQVSADGTLETGAAIPDYAEAGSQVVFVIDTGPELLVSDRVDVVDRSGPDAGGRELVTVEGHVRQGVECPIIETRDGRVFALIGPFEFQPGAYAEVDGYRIEVSICMQGDDTLDVRNMEPVAAPAN